MFRIGMTGVPGSGKTTLSRLIGPRLRELNVFSNVELVSEYARRWLARYPIDSPLEQYRILQKQLEWEDRIPDSVPAFVTDSPLHLNLFYTSQLLSRSLDPRNNVYAADVFSQFIKLHPRYDVVFHLPPKRKPVADGVRPSENFDDVWRADADCAIRGLLTTFPPRYGWYLIEGVTNEERVEEIVDKLRNIVVTLC